MAGAKITGFMGTAPKMAPELLGGQLAQVAKNCKLYSGNLIPYPRPVSVGATGRTGEVKTIYGLRNPTTDALVWLSWPGEVDIATPTPADSDVSEQRFYYTGDGAPKVSTYALATSGPAPYPVDYYDLGLPLPDTIVNTVVTSFTKSLTASVARDNGNTATYVMQTAHGLRTGNVVSITGFNYRSGTYTQTAATITVSIIGHGMATGAQVVLDFTSGNSVDGVFNITVTGPDTFTVSGSTSGSTSGNVNWNYQAFNGTSVEVTVVNPTTFTVYSPGPAIATTPITSGEVDLGGLTTTRTYVYTWYTPWGEESIGSEPSTAVYLKEGQTVTVTGLPTAPPPLPAKTFARGVRLYRTVTGTSQTEYFLLKTLWFPQSIASVSRTANVSRVRLSDPHDLLADDRFKISGCPVGSFNITDGIVTKIVDEYTFEYAQTAVDNVLTTTTGTLFYDVAERVTNTARYWGDGSYTFIDDFDVSNLTISLASDEYDAPPAGLQGLKAIQNTILAGFVGNTVYFSDPGLPHSWPAKYAQTLEHEIVGIEPIGGVGVFVGTKAYSYLLSGSDPSTMSLSRTDALHPCLNRRSIVNMGYGVIYSTHEGLASASSQTGNKIVTASVHDADTWQAALNPASVIAAYYGGEYVAGHSTGSFIFTQDDKSGGYITDFDEPFSALWFDARDNRLFYATGLSGDVFEWDDLAQPPQTMEWKSKVMISPDFGNLGAAAVMASYGNQTTVWELTGPKWEDANVLWNSPTPLVFKLWADKELIYEGEVSDRSIFRLPTGYRTDTIEVAITGTIRVQSIHLGENPLSLKQV